MRLSLEGGGKVGVGKKEMGGERERDEEGKRVYKRIVGGKVGVRKKGRGGGRERHEQGKGVYREDEGKVKEGAGGIEREGEGRGGIKGEWG